MFYPSFVHSLVRWFVLSFDVYCAYITFRVFMCVGIRSFVRSVDCAFVHWFVCLFVVYYNYSYLFVGSCRKYAVARSFDSFAN